MKQRLRKKLLKNYDIHIAKLYPDDIWMTEKIIAYLHLTDKIIAYLHRTVGIFHSSKKNKVYAYRSDSHKAYKRLKLMKRLRNNVLIKN